MSWQASTPKRFSMLDMTYSSSKSQYPSLKASQPLFTWKHWAKSTSTGAPISLQVGIHSDIGQPYKSQYYQICIIEIRTFYFSTSNRYKLSMKCMMYNLTYPKFWLMIIRTNLWNVSWKYISMSFWHLIYLICSTKCPRLAKFWGQFAWKLANFFCWQSIYDLVVAIVAITFCQQNFIATWSILWIHRKRK